MVMPTFVLDLLSLFAPHPQDFLPYVEHTVPRNCPSDRSASDGIAGGIAIHIKIHLARIRIHKRIIRQASLVKLARRILFALELDVLGLQI